MQRRIYGVLAGLAIVVAACGAQAATEQPGASGTPRPASIATGQGDLVFAVAGDHIVAVDGASGASLRSVPGTLVASDWSAAYAVIPAPGGGIVRVTDPATGTAIRDIAVPAGFNLPAAYGASPGALSPDGNWLVLAAAAQRSGAAVRSGFQIVDTRTGSADPPITLDGDYAFDAMSNDGSHLYLVEHPTSDPTRYRVRIYDRRMGQLAEQAVVDKTVSPPDGLMRGIYTASVAGPHGQWNFGLYFNPSKGPFVHALNLEAQYAQCILDIPAGAGAPGKAGLWSLVGGPRGATVYAVNGDLGTIAAIDTASVKVVASATLPGTSAGSERHVSGGAVVSPDGMRLYTVEATGVLVVNLGDLSLRGRYLSDRTVDSLALSPDGARLYALSRDSATLWRVDASTGRPLGGSSLAGATALLRTESGRN